MLRWLLGKTADEPPARMMRLQPGDTIVAEDCTWEPVQEPNGEIKPEAQAIILKTAEWHAFRALQVAYAGDEEEARLHLKDAGEFLAQIGGPANPKTAEEVFTFAADRQVGER